jgi:ER lumen protein retaining receptor
LYNSSMKVVFITSQLYILYLMRYQFRPTNDMQIDTFKVEYLLGGASVLAFIATYKYTFQEVR